jgi:hypothetical protein
MADRRTAFNAFQQHKRLLEYLVDYTVGPISLVLAPSPTTVDSRPPIGRTLKLFTGADRESSGTNNG